MRENFVKYTSQDTWVLFRVISLLPTMMTIDITVMCLNFGTPKIINFPFGTNERLIIFRCPNTYAHQGRNSLTKQARPKSGSSSYFAG